ncbi:hypothetical protein [Streptosporangium saharense]|uniref:hypothetical protein n=1 Tax=Streptosporangium saharense TaxID=1706840 RepID=UPI003675B235
MPQDVFIDPVVDLSDYELVWPPHLFADEANRILGGSQRLRSNNSAIGRLLEEAFRDSSVVEDFNALTNGAIFGLERSIRLNPDAFVRELIVRSPEIPMHSSPRAYWKRPGSDTTDADKLDISRARREFAALIDSFRQNGYLDQVFPRECVDNSGMAYADPSQEIGQRLGATVAWPLTADAWDDDTFFGLLEVFNDLVSRPREAWYHNFASCGMHYSSFASEPGRRLYRWRVNRILSDANVPYRIEEVGELVGRIVPVSSLADAPKGQED